MNVNDIKRIACLGGGVIGRSMATAFLFNGYEVNIYFPDSDEIADCDQSIRNNLQTYVKYNVLAQEKVKSLMNHVIYTTDLAAAISDVQYIQENAPEDLNLKRELLQAVDTQSPAEAIFATSSSFLLISEIARGSKHPQRCIGAHPYNPPHLIPLIELSKDSEMPDDAINTAYDLFTKMKKQPIILKKEVPGYLVNQIAADLYKQTCMLVINGVCSLEDIDKAICYGPALRWALMGPNLVYELGGGTGGIRKTIEGITPAPDEDPTVLEQKRQLNQFWLSIAEPAVAEALANRDPDLGNTREGLAEFRDRGLIELLRLHKLLI